MRILSYILILACISSCTSQIKVPPVPIPASTPELEQEEKTTCDVAATGYKERTFKSSYERYNASDALPLYCAPSTDSPLADTLYSITRLDVLEHGDVDSVSWCRVRTHRFPQKSGWIKTGDFSKKVLKVNSRTTFVGRAFPAPNQYYDGYAEMYSIVNDRVKDTLGFSKIHGGDFQLSFIENHSLNNVTKLLRYESHHIDSKEHYYQDIVAYIDGRFIPFIFTDKSTGLGTEADTEEYTIYLPYTLSDGELILAPVFEHRGRLTEQEMIDKQYRFTKDISIPKDQCIIKFYESADHNGKLKVRSTEVFHWNGSDLARMYGSDFNFQETELK